MFFLLKLAIDKFLFNFIHSVSFSANEIRGKNMNNESDYNVTLRNIYST